MLSPLQTQNAHDAAEEAERYVPPETFDETVDEIPQVPVEADFTPLLELEPEGESRADIDPYQYDSLQAQEAFDAAVELAKSGDRESAVREFLRASKIAETAHEWYVAAVACHRVGEFLLEPSPPHDVERAFRMFRRAVAAYEACGLFAEARELAYRQMCCKLWRMRELRLPWLHRVELVLHWAIAGFGYRPTRVIAAAATIVVLYGFAYWLTRGMVPAAGPGPINLGQCLYFSGTTFATVGYGDFIPAPHVRMLALSEAFLGVFTMGLFVAVLANRLSKA